MRYYELLYIVNPNLEDDKAKGIIDEIGTEIGKYKVSIINHYMWGKKRLAYPIKNNKYGIYILLQFSADKFDFLKEFERFLILNKSVIRHQIVGLDTEPATVEAVEIIAEDDDSNDEKGFDSPDEDTDIDSEDEEDIEESESEEEIKEEGKK